MHSVPYDDSAGHLSAAIAVVDLKCQACEAASVNEQQWESFCGGFVDHKYTCRECGHVWWIDGIDS